LRGKETGSGVGVRVGFGEGDGIGVVEMQARIMRALIRKIIVGLFIANYPHRLQKMDILAKRVVIASDGAAVR
jgi:hypothetical protein